MILVNMCIRKKTDINAAEMEEIWWLLSDHRNNVKEEITTSKRPRKLASVPKTCHK